MQRLVASPESDSPPAESLYAGSLTITQIHTSTIKQNFVMLVVKTKSTVKYPGDFGRNLTNVETKSDDNTFAS